MSEPTEGGTNERLIERLLAPLDGERSAGEDIRLDVSPQSLYYRLRDARFQARAAERAADNDPSLGNGVPPEWADVQDLATDALATRGKDIEVACWLTESLTRRQGLPGLADGAELLAGLIDGFWSDGLFPPAQEDDPEARLASISGLSGQDRDGSLLQPLRKLVLFDRPDGRPITLWDYERSAKLAASGAGSDAKPAAGVVPFAEIEADARGPGLPALRALDRQIVRAGTSWKRLEETIARTVTAEAQPSTGRVRGVLEVLRQTTARYVPADVAEVPPDEDAASAKARAEDGPLDGAPSSLQAGATSGSVPDGVRSSGPSRDVLLDEILKIAAIFRRSEPNAPIGFTLEEAVRRARLPWPDLLRELVSDPVARTTVMTTVGMRPPEADASAAQS